MLTKRGGSSTAGDITYGYSPTSQASPTCMRNPGIGRSWMSCSRASRVCWCLTSMQRTTDGVPCPQQKCLIHLMRDINEDLHKNPFDDSLKDIAIQFGVLLRDIVATIDMHGLKA